MNTKHKVTKKEVMDAVDYFHGIGMISNQYGDAEHYLKILLRKVANDYLNRDEFLKSFFSSSSMQGINAMSISDITGIPRATVIRKLRKLVKQKNLIIDNKKHYRLTGNIVKKLKPLQKNILVHLANFSTKIFNSHLVNNEEEY